MITEQQVKFAIDIIERYKVQQLNLIEPSEDVKDSRSVYHLNLTTRDYNVFKNYGIKTIGDLLDLDRGDLLKMRNMGTNGVNRINKSLHDLGIEYPPFIL